MIASPILNSSISIRPGFPENFNETTGCYSAEIISQVFKIGSALNFERTTKAALYLLGIFSGIMQNDACKPKTEVYSYTEGLLDVTRFSLTLLNPHPLKKVIDFVAQPLLSVCNQYVRDTKYTLSELHANFEKSIALDDPKRFNEALNKIDPNAYFGPRIIYYQKPTYTPLALVAINGTSWQTQSLIDAGADPTRESGYNRFPLTPIQISVNSGNADVFSYLYKNVPATKECLTPSGQTLAEFVFSKPVPNLKIYEEIIKSPPQKPGLVFHKAITYKLGLDVEKTIKTLKSLLANEIGDINATNEIGFTPLHSLISMQHFFELVRPQLHLDPETVPIEAIWHKEIEVKSDRSLAYRFLNSISQLSLEHTLAIIDLLIENGVDVNAQDNFGNTALHWAAYHDFSPEIMKALEDAGGNIHLGNNDKWTTYQMKMTVESASSKQNPYDSQLKPGLTYSEQEEMFFDLRFKTYEKAFQKLPEEERIEQHELYSNVTEAANKKNFDESLIALEKMIRQMSKQPT